MNPIDTGKARNGEPEISSRKPYVPPAFKTVTPAEAKELLLCHADPSDPEVRRMLECVEELQKKLAS